MEESLIYSSVKNHFQNGNNLIIEDERRGSPLITQVINKNIIKEGVTISQISLHGSRSMTIKFA